MNQEKFFSEFLDLFKRQEILSKFGYNKMTRILSGLSSRLFFSRNEIVSNAQKNMVRYLNLSATKARKESLICTKNFGLAFLNIFFYEKMDKKWIEKNFHYENKALVTEIVQEGGVLITFHTYHHNTLGCFFGILGAKVLGISAAKNPEHDNEKIRKYHIDIMHKKSEQKFGGGRYLFLNNLKDVVRGVNKGLEENSLIIGLSDFPARNKTIKVKFLEEEIHIQRWLFDIASSKKNNVYFGLLEGRSITEKLNLHLARANPGNAEELAQQYIDFLASKISENPACWQGWEWFHFIKRQ